LHIAPDKPKKNKMDESKTEQYKLQNPSSS